jgi:hypothetical protein
MAAHSSLAGASSSGATGTIGENSGDTHTTDEQYLAGVRRSIIESIQVLEKHSKRVVDAVWTLGRNLTNAKNRVPHGEWETWIRVNTPLSPRTAQLYMQISSWLDGLAPEKAQCVAVSTLSQLIKAMSAASDAEAAHELSPANQASPPANNGGATDAIELRERMLETLSLTSAELKRAFDEMSSSHEVIPSCLDNLKEWLTRSLDAVRELQRSSRAEKKQRLGTA